MVTLSFLKALIVCGCLSWVAGQQLTPEGVQFAVCLIFAGVLGAGLVIIHGEYQRQFAPAPQFVGA